MIVKQFFKELITSLNCLMIALSLTLFTYPQGNAYADESEYAQNVAAETGTDCEKDTENENGSAGVYKPGCKFNDALGKIGESPDKGIEGIIEQFIGIAFASVAVSSVIFTNTPRSLADCPSNHNAQLTLRMMQAGALFLSLIHI